MEEPEKLYLTKRARWRDWLSANFRTRKEIWLIYPKKSSGKPRLEYNTAVEEALCFGWIDSTVKTLDEAHTMQRFTVRRPHSSYSQANKERIRSLFKKGKIHPSVLPSITPVLKEKYDYPADIIARLKRDSKVWKNYQSFSEPYKRIRIAYIDGARKRPEEFEKRLRNFIDKTRANTLIKGFGGIDKYY